MCIHARGDFLSVCSPHVIPYFFPIFSFPTSELLSPINSLLAVIYTLYVTLRCCSWNIPGGGNNHFSLPRLNDATMYRPMCTRVMSALGNFAAVYYEIYFESSHTKGKCARGVDSRQCDLLLRSRTALGRQVGYKLRRVQCRVFACLHAV
jgi:hypothetical protein